MPFKPANFEIYFSWLIFLFWLLLFIIDISNIAIYDINKNYLLVVNHSTLSPNICKLFISHLVSMYKTILHAIINIYSKYIRPYYTASFKCSSFNKYTSQKNYHKNFFAEVFCMYNDYAV